jgi:hypothetical protein
LRAEGYSPSVEHRDLASLPKDVVERAERAEALDQVN